MSLLLLITDTLTNFKFIFSLLQKINKQILNKQFFINSQNVDLRDLQRVLFSTEIGRIFNDDS